MWLFKKKNPIDKLQEKYEQMMADAMSLQRSGKIPEFAKKTAEANSVLAEIEELKKQAS